MRREPAAMIVYPLSPTEERIVRYIGRAAVVIVVAMLLIGVI